MQQTSTAGVGDDGAARTWASLVQALTDGDLPFRFTAYDGSTAGPTSAGIEVHLRDPRGLTLMGLAPGTLALARAHLTGGLEVRGCHPADPYPALALASAHWRMRRPAVGVTLALARKAGIHGLVPPRRPAEEGPPRWRRSLALGRRNGQRRDAHAVASHYDLPVDFYRLLLGPTLTYSCAYFPDDETSLEQAQTAKHDLVLDKLGLEAGQRLLDVGCGWGGLVLRAAERGIHAVGVTLSAEQADAAAARIRAADVGHRARVVHADYRDITEGLFDGISSIGMTEHVGPANYPVYFGRLLDRLRPGGRLLNHMITKPAHDRAGMIWHAGDRVGSRRSFIDRYVFPDAELPALGRVIGSVHDTGFEVRHTENLREHYARTCRSWSQNLQQNWDQAVDLVGERRARIWGLYIAASALAFETDRVQIHQILAVKPHPDGRSDFPRTPVWATASVRGAAAGAR